MVGVPPSAPVIAQPAPGVQLRAWDSGSNLCLAVTGAARFASVECTPPPTAGEAPPLGYQFGGSRRSWHFGATTSDVASVELRFTRAPTNVRVDTVAGEAYTGAAAGRVRFFVAAGPSFTPWLTVQRGADGSVLSAQQRPGVGLEDFPLAGPVRALRGGLRAQSHAELRATPADAARLERVTCVALRRTGGGRALARACADQGPLGLPLRWDVGSTCGRTGIAGVVAPSVSGVVAVLGDGTRRALPLVDVPGVQIPLNATASAPAPLRAFSLEVGRRVAVRRLIVRAPSGATSEPVGRAPSAVGCIRFELGGFAIGFDAFTIDAQGHTPDSPVLVRDLGTRLCVALGRFDPWGGDCAMPPLGAKDARIVEQGGAVAVVAPASVRLVRLTLDRGGKRDVAPMNGVYDGQYAGAVSVFSYRGTGGERATQADLLDAAGRSLYGQPLAAAFPATPSAHTVARARGIRLLAPRERLGCWDTRPGATQVGCLPVANGVLNLAATCAPRRLVLVAPRERDLRGFDVRLAGGQTVTARRAGPRALWLVLGPHDRPTRLDVLGRRARRSVRAPIPPAAAQCGYTAGIPAARTPF